MVCRIGGTDAQRVTQIRPMLASSGPVPEGPGWAFEFAWDGARVIADVSAERVRLIGGDQGFAASCPELDVLRRVAGRRRLVLDGTIVALDAFGRPSFTRLQRRMAVQRPTAAMLHRLPVAYYVFDVLCHDGLPTVDLPYEARRELLEKLDLPGGAVELVPAFSGAGVDGAAVLDTAARYGLHGVVAKRLRSRYQPGRRSRAWVETALRHCSDVVVGGWLADRTGAVRALVVGTPTGGGLRFAGTVSAGLDDAQRYELAELLAGIGRPTSPFVGPGAPRARWVVPELLGEVSYRRRGTSGRLDRPTWVRLYPGRHPVPVASTTSAAGPDGAVHAAGGASGGAVDEGSGAVGDTRGDTSNGAVDEAGGAPGWAGGAVDGTSGEAAGAAGGVFGDAGWVGLEEELRVARAEVDALRAQISPHFLYNVLNMIGSYIRTDPPLARELLGDFADFTRYAFRTGVPLSTIGEELDNVERYLTLQRARFGDRLRVRLRVAPDALPVAVPYLALQLAVEHAVQHGLEPKPGGGTLTVTVVSDGPHWLVSVSDDGVGTAALSSLDQRLRSAYGDRNGITVRTADGGGTTVTFRVPAVP